jgi:hypothetical protein
MNTRFLLMAQYGARAIIPLDDVARDYFSMTPDKLQRKITSGEIMLPLVRMDARSQKSARGVHIDDLAAWIDKELDAAKDAEKPSEELARRRAATNRKAFVYFMRSGDFIKIGFSADPKSRLHAMLTSNPAGIEIVRIVKGTKKTEREYHERFRAYRHHREWFRLEGGLKDWLGKING